MAMIEPADPAEPRRRESYQESYQETCVLAPLPAAKSEPATTARSSEVSPVDCAANRPIIVVIEHRALIRDCLVKSLEDTKSDDHLCAYATVAEWLRARPDPLVAALILLCTAVRKEPDVERDIALLTQADPGGSIVLLSDGEDSARVLGALDKGARGYIPTSLSLDMAVKALHFVRAGGTFIPAASLMASRGAIEHRPAAGNGARDVPFTARQSAVVEALRQGMANKAIAHELNIRESTVKVHVRNIMKKLQAKNRTEVAFRVNSLAPDYSP